MTDCGGLISGADLMEKSFPSITMLTNFLPSRAFVLIAGIPGAGKTEFFTHQAIEAASKGPVLFFCNEGGWRDLQMRQSAYCKDRAILKNLFWIRQPWPKFTDADKIAEFAFKVEKYRPKAIFIDPGPDAFGEENDAAILKEPLQKIYDLIEKHQFCLTLSWHTAKEHFSSGVYNFRGSSSIAGKLDVMYDLTFQGKKRKLTLHKLRIECPGLRQGQKWLLDRIENESGKNLLVTVAPEAADRAEEKKKRLSETLSQFFPGKEYTATEIVNGLVKAFQGEIKDGTAKNCLKEWTKQREFDLIRQSKGRKPAIYRRTDMN